MARDGDLRAIFRRNLPAFDFQAIESPLTSRGIPDCNYCCMGKEGWIEAKRTSAWAVKIAPEQVGWISRRLRHGGRVWIAVRRQVETSAKRYKTDELWMVRGEQAAALKSGGLKDLRSGFYVFSGRWDWKAIGFLLMSD